MSRKVDRDAVRHYRSNEMADPSSILRNSGLGMALIRERLGLRAPRSTQLEAALQPLATEIQAVEIQAEAALPAAAQRRAAVALVLREHVVHGEPEVLFIRRAEHPNDPWSGHMAFPGGREEPSDGDLLQTAMRETREEVSLDLQTQARLLGRLDELPAVARGRRTGLMIAPFVFELTPEAASMNERLKFNDEVSEVVWAPLGPLFRGELATTFSYEIGGQRLELPAHDVSGRVVWGLTHRMLETLFALLR